MVMVGDAADRDQGARHLDPARTCVRSHGSAGSPSPRARWAYSAMGVAGSRCLPVGRTGATSSRKPRARAFRRIAESMDVDRPPPCRSGRIAISIALTVSGGTARRWSENAQISTWSHPVAGSAPRPGAASANGTPCPRATSSPSPSVATSVNSGNMSPSRPMHTEPTGSCRMNSGQESGIRQSCSPSSGRSASVVIVGSIPGG